MSTDAILNRSETYSDFDRACDQSEPKWTELNRTANAFGLSKSRLNYAPRCRLGYFGHDLASQSLNPLKTHLHYSLTHYKINSAENT